MEFGRGRAEVRYLSLAESEVAVCLTSNRSLGPEAAETGPEVRE